MGGAVVEVAVYRVAGMIINMTKFMTVPLLVVRMAQPNLPPMGDPWHKSLRAGLFQLVLHL